MGNVKCNLISCKHNINNMCTEVDIKITISLLEVKCENYEK